MKKASVRIEMGRILCSDDGKAWTLRVIDNVGAHKLLLSMSLTNEELGRILGTGSVTLEAEVYEREE